MGLFISGFEDLGFAKLGLKNPVFSLLITKHQEHHRKERIKR